MIKKLIQLGKKKYDLDDPGEVLRHLHVIESRCATDLAKMFDETPTFIRMCMERFKVPLGFKPRIFREAAKLGFESLGEFFVAKGCETFVTMSEELKVSESVIRHYYEEWVRMIGELNV